MDTATLTEALLEEAEAIVRAEWLRLNDGQLRDHELVRRCADMPKTRHRPPQAVGTMVAGGPLGVWRDGAGGDQPAGRWLPQRVSPTQRSPPPRRSAVPKGVVQERGDALTDEHEHVVTRAGHNCPITV